MGYLEQSQATGRHIFPDLARAFALFGIAVVNVAIMSHPMMSGYAAGALNGSADYAAHFGVSAIFLMKSYTLFSFMFGVGFAYQMQSAERRGVAFSGRYWRRIFGLFVFGMINIAFVFQGDILVTYALLGSVLFLFRNASARTLSGWAIGLYSLQIIAVVMMTLGVWAWVTFDPDNHASETALMDEEGLAAALAFREGTFIEALIQRYKDWFGVITFGTLFQGIGALAFFLFGFSAVRRGTIADPTAEFWRRCRRVFLPIGLVVSSVGAWFIVQGQGMMDPTMMLGMTLICLGSPFSTAGYLGLIAKWAAGPDGPIKTFLARGGTASLTAYLLQGLLLSLIFNAYGLGLFGQFGAATCIAIGAGVAIISIVFSSLWRAKFERGPLEVILRRWTYLGRV
ncbi:MAG: DUF418 domain-containing protein [Henriciella sp.]|nr:DUF418 domain-containing protein [Henriciella sp.]